MKILNYLNASELTNEIRKNSLSLNIIFICTLILPFSLYLGPAIIELLIFLICVSYLYIITSKKEKIYFNNLILFFLSFYVLLILSSLLSNYILISLKSSLLSIRFAILTFAIIHILKKTNCFLKFFFISSFLCIALLFLSGLSQFLFSEDYWVVNELKNIGVAQSLRHPLKNTIITGFFAEEKKLGSFIARLSPLIIGLYFFISKNEMRKKINSALLYFAPLFLIGFFTGERMAMIYLSITLFFLLIFSIKNNKKNIYKLIIFLMIPFILFFANINQFQLLVKNSYDQFYSSGSINYPSEQHRVFAITSIKLFKNNLILGIGPNNYRRKCNEISSDIFFRKGVRNTIKIGMDSGHTYDHTNIRNCSTHPHNIFFQLLSEIGLLGIIYYAIFNIFLFVQIIKFFFKKDYNQISFFFLLPVIYYLNPIFPAGNFFNNWYMCFGILGVPFYLYLARIKKSD